MFQQTIIRKNSCDWFNICCSFLRSVVIIRSDRFAVCLPNNIVVPRDDTIFVIAINSSVLINTKIMLMRLFTNCFFLIALQTTLTLIMEGFTVAIVTAARVMLKIICHVAVVMICIIQDIPVW